MKTVVSTAVACAAGLCFAAFAHDKPHAKSAKPQSVTIAAQDVKWGAAPAAFPAGAQRAVCYTGAPS
jgi:hypothetical protein